MKAKIVYTHIYRALQLLMIIKIGLPWETLQRERKQTQFPVSSLRLNSSIDTSLLVLSHSVMTDMHMCAWKRDKKKGSSCWTLFFQFNTSSYVCAYVWFFLFKSVGAHTTRFSKLHLTVFCILPPCSHAQKSYFTLSSGNLIFYPLKSAKSWRTELPNWK